MGMDMKLKDMSDIHSGHITRGKIDVCPSGSHYLLQAKDVDAARMSYKTDLSRFHPVLSRSDRLLADGDLLFLAKGTHNITIRVEALPGPALAAASFFIVRPTSQDLLPGYLCWYLNQAPVAQYLIQHSGRGVHMPVVRRAVLENIEVPLPPLDIQTKIAGMSQLMLKEMDLLQLLGKKRSELITAACLQTISDN
ncbi:MAG: restriction endonuclease subunit S [Desulfobacteraceae bacterium]|nr:MAG: restriction endonuclease subunit S [Desulfobacteraceae bacterium]